MSKTVHLPGLSPDAKRAKNEGMVQDKRRRRNTALVLLATFVAGTALVYATARREISAAYRWIDSSDSQILNTACGITEYVIKGEGQPVLLIHGTSGGIMQGLLLSEQLGEGFRFIIPSRFGYFDTPLPADATPAAQAENYLCLLDALGEKQVAVWAVSAGALSAVELAAHHPERVSGLVLMSPAAWSPDMDRDTQPVSPFVTTLIKEVVLKSDMALWLMSKVARPPLMGFLGIPPAVDEKMTPDERALADQVVRTLLTISRQQGGLMNDTRNHEARQRPALEQITAPTLLLTAADDPFVTQPGAQYLATQIANAQLIELQQGGHQLVGGLEYLWEQEAVFLRQAAVAAP